LLSDDGGRTFQEWVNMLGGKSVNGVPVLFPYDESVPYHLYWQVLNAKNHGVPQNRERVFLIGIRDDADNRFQFPREEHLTKRLKDVLEDEVDEKYLLTPRECFRLMDFLIHSLGQLATHKHTSKQATQSCECALQNPKTTSVMRCKNCKEKFEPIRFNHKYCLKDECVRAFVAEAKEKMWKQTKAKMKNDIKTNSDAA
jgi:hypothetical protein